MRERAIKRYTRERKDIMHVCISCRAFFARRRKRKESPRRLSRRAGAESRRGEKCMDYFFVVVTFSRSDSPAKLRYSDVNSSRAGSRRGDLETKYLFIRPVTKRALT